MKTVFRISVALTLILLTGLQLTAQKTQAPALSDTIDVTHYGLHLTVTDFTNHIITGQAQVTFTTPLNNIHFLPLELKQLQVDSVKNADNIQLSFTHTGDLLRISLDEAISVNDTSMVVVYYHGTPFHESWGGFHFSGSYAFNLGVGFVSVPHNLGKAWFPCIDDFIDRAYYDYYITVENDKTAVCGGLLQSVAPVNDQTRLFHWKSDRTLPTYLASVAVGPYSLVSDSFSGMQAEIPVTYYVRPSDTTRARGSFLNMPLIAGNFEEAFGPYPFQRIGITGTSLGAMEHAENIFYPNGSINGNLSDEWLYTHELSHMWFGNKVTCSSDADMWLNEGWARWCETLYREKLYGTESAKNNMRSLMRNVLQYIHTTEGGYRPLSPMPSEYTYGDNVYDKGGMTVHALRGYMGDSLFFNGVQTYLSTFAFKPASSYDLRDALSASSGIDLTDFFNFHVFGPGFNQCSVDSFKVYPAGNEFDIAVFMKQRLKGTDVYAMDCRSELAFMNDLWQTETRKISFQGSHGSALFRLPFIPALVMTDLNEKSGDATTDQYKTIKTTGLYDFTDTFFKLDVTEISDSAFVRITHNWVPPDSLRIPQSGLKLSDYRYWSVEGIFPEGFHATGRFSYNRNGYLDNTLLTNSADSLVILYRPDASSDWMPVSFTKTGPWQIGTIYVPQLRPGDYTLAVWDAVYVGSNLIPDDDQLFRVYPNPATGVVNIETNARHTGVLSIHDTSGKLVYLTDVAAENQHFRWNCSLNNPGTYLVSLISSQGCTSSKKILIQP